MPGDLMRDFALKQRQLERRLDRLETLEHASIRTPELALPLTLNLIMGLTGLRGFWPGSGQGKIGSGAFHLTDISGNGQHFLDNNRPRQYFGDAPERTPIVHFNGTNEWFSIADSWHWDILGTEDATGSDWKGLTIGTWIYFDNTASAPESIIAKQMASTNLSYWLRRNASGQIVFGISNTGTTQVNVHTGGTTVDAGSWNLLIGRFDPSTELALWVNGVKYTNTTSIPASIYSGAADLFMGGRDDATTPGQNLMNAWTSLNWILAAKIPDEVSDRIWNVSRHNFNI